MGRCRNTPGQQFGHMHAMFLEIRVGYVGNYLDARGCEGIERSVQNSRTRVGRLGSLMLLLTQYELAGRPKRYRVQALETGARSTTLCCRFTVHPCTVHHSVRPISPATHQSHLGRTSLTSTSQSPQVTKHGDSANQEREPVSPLDD